MSEMDDSLVSWLQCAFQDVSSGRDLPAKVESLIHQLSRKIIGHARSISKVEKLPMAESTFGRILDASDDTHIEYSATKWDPPDLWPPDIDYIPGDEPLCGEGRPFVLKQLPPEHPACQKPNALASDDLAIPTSTAHQRRSSRPPPGLPKNRVHEPSSLLGEAPSKQSTSSSSENIAAKITLPADPLVSLPTTSPEFHQMGLFANQDLPAYFEFGPYTGYLLAAAKANQYYSFSMGESTGLSVDASTSGNCCRFINDYRNTGLPLNAETLYINDNVYFSLIRDVREGEEILIDYGTLYWKHYNRKRPREPSVA